MDVNAGSSLRHSALLRSGLFKHNPIDQYMRKLQMLRNERVHDNVDLKQNPVARLLEALAYSIKNGEHQPQGSTDLMQQLNQYDVKEIKSCAVAALLSENAAVRTYLSLIETLEGEADYKAPVI